MAKHSALLNDVIIEPYDRVQGLPFRIYSLNPKEQAAYEVLVYWLRQVENRLAEEPGKVMTPSGAIGGHAYWLINGNLASGLEAGQAHYPLPRSVADAPFWVEDIEGLGAQDLLDIAEEAKLWLADPEFVRLQDDQYMGSGNPQEQYLERRRGIPVSQPYRRHGISGDIEVVVRDGWVVSIDGDDVEIFLDYPRRALMAGAGYVRHIVMYVPELELIGRPSCFDLLDTPQLLKHLCHGTGFSPLSNVRDCASWEVKASDGSISMEYQFSLSPDVVRVLEMDW